MGVVLILMGVFQFCFAFILAKMYEEVKDIKANTLFSLSYIESLLVCIKNKMEKNKNSDEE